MQNLHEELNAVFQANDLALIFLAIAIGLVIGSEREYNNKSAGLRTLMLVSVSSSIFTILSIKIGDQSHDRIAANIITGIGFLGAGVIFKDENRINGLTTACTIWVTAALGMAAGSGHVFLAIFGTLVVLGVLGMLVYAENFISRRHTVISYRITVARPEFNEEIEHIFRENNISAKKVFNSKSEKGYVFTWKGKGKSANHRAAQNALINCADLIDLTDR